MPRRSRKRLTIVAGIALLASALVGCSVIDPVAIRLNADGTLDFALCYPIDAVVELEASLYLRDGDYDDAHLLSAVTMPDYLQVGDVVTFDTSDAEDDWDRVYVSAYGYVDEGADTNTAYGIFDIEDLTVDEWVWAGEWSPDQYGACEINE